mmetsp:Transcript_15955/g.41942  ORF Transcript_15955/g.41942 Transcript_15955/m.41942 type:complete len:119 (-) Transcript_15955:483-839(-)|eukprot:CAMPEP_0119479936 /NCGR_PEP_ID=MMETSP1344-20130328/8978_1 /TAXON_ID=236787 /ORGANISM="Florenciella parvula, Strain CCMP2471" /LENGTH=118 /DNA_ID=CAMNT_0007514213 /DNA_START=53 /DNA_END=409 /DNA_ORIENTATION=+
MQAVLTIFLAMLGLVAAQKSKEDSSFISKVYDAISIPVGGAMEAFQAKYAMLPFADSISFPVLVVSVVSGAIALWLITKLLDPRPYLYNSGKLGKLEKKSVFVCPKTGEYVPPKKTAA